MVLSLNKRVWDWILYIVKENVIDPDLQTYFVLLQRNSLKFAMYILYLL